ncbi:MAG TPA: molybdopterin-dependent oxidoreductase [Isosphaeraceae bacterium]|jgi:DMSO/TMAO reductase YedYZ molybdopterin-dependent catalytic subunit|nr:molybdopterin-dependent oxidoreductase [Isosphaeraceae bacterium]
MGLRRLSWTYTGSTGDDRTYFTPPDRFYHVDHGGIPAPIVPETLTLQIAGQVARPRTFTYAELTDRLQRHGITRFVKCLQCLRDPLGDDVEKRWYASSGLWGGLPLSVLLDEVGVLPGSKRIDYGGRDPSGFFASLPLERALTPRDDLPILLATELNGSPLTHCRGGPVRLLAPDLLGFKSIKWLSWLCVTDSCVPNGWYERGRGVHLPPDQKDPTLKTIARIAPVPDASGHPTHPRLCTFQPGQPLMFRGYAVAGTRGLAGVRFRVGRGHGPGPHDTVTEGQALLEAPGSWGLPGPFPEGVTHFSGDRPQRWPLPAAWVYWQAWFGPLPSGRYHFEVWAVDLEGHEQPCPDPNEHSGSAMRENVAFHVG